VAGSWYGLALWQGGETFFQMQIMKENVMRFVSINTMGAGHEHPFYYFIPNLLLGMAPWSFFFPALAVFLYQCRGTWHDRDLLYPIVWIATIFLFYSAASGKRTVYILPLYPPLALLLGVWWQELRQGSLHLPGTLAWLLRGGGYLCFLTIVLAVLIVFSQLLGHDPLGLIRPFLHPKDQGNLPFFSNVVSQHPFAFLLWFGVVGPAAVLLLRCLYRQQWGGLFPILVAFTFSTFLLVHSVFQPIVATARTFRPFMTRVKQQVSDAPLFFYKAFDNGALYYANRHIPHYNAELLKPGQAFFLLTWEEEWRKLADQDISSLRAADLSEGTGPKGNHRLVLIATPADTPLPADTTPAEGENTDEDEAP
jgi:hypothetical protein